MSLTLRLLPYTKTCCFLRDSDILTWPGLLEDASTVLPSGAVLVAN